MNHENNRNIKRKRTADNSENIYEKYDSLNKKYEKSLISLEIVKEDKVRLENENVMLEKSLAVFKDRYDRLKTDFDNLKSKHRKVKDNFKKSQEKYAEMKCSVKKCEGEVRTAYAKTETAEMKLKLKDHDITALNNELNKNVNMLNILGHKTPPNIVDTAKLENVALYADRKLNIIYFVYCQSKTFLTSVKDMKKNCMLRQKANMELVGEVYNVPNGTKAVQACKEALEKRVYAWEELWKGGRCFRLNSIEKIRAKISAKREKILTNNLNRKLPRKEKRELQELENLDPEKIILKIEDVYVNLYSNINILLQQANRAR